MYSKVHRFKTTNEEPVVTTPKVTMPSPITNFQLKLYFGSAIGITKHMEIEEMVLFNSTVMPFRSVQCIGLFFIKMKLLPPSKGGFSNTKAECKVRICRTVERRTLQGGQGTSLKYNPNLS